MNIKNFQIKNGSEGPSNDPYGYREYSFMLNNIKHTIHLGLAQWIKIGAEASIKALGNHYDNEDAFIKATIPDLDYSEFLDEIQVDESRDFGEDPMGPPSRYI